MNEHESGALPLGHEGDAPSPAGAPPSSSPMAVIRIEGQEFELERALAEDDATLRSVLRPHYAALENASITREEKNGRLQVTVVKRAQHKGAEEGKERLAALRMLENEPETFNPALALAARLGSLPMDRPLADAEIDEATAVLEFSRAEIERMNRWQANLAAAGPSAAPRVPAGF